MSNFDLYSGEQTARTIAALFNCSERTARRILGRLRAVRVSRGKYIVPSADMIVSLAAMQQSPRTAQAPISRGVSRELVPTHAAPQRRGVMRRSPDPSPRLEASKKEKGKVEDCVNNQQVADNE